MALLGEEDLCEIGCDKEVRTSLARLKCELWQQAERLLRANAAGDEVAVEDLLGDPGVRKTGERAADVTSRIPEL